MTEESTPQPKPEADQAWFSELADAAVEPTETASCPPLVQPAAAFGDTPYLPPLDRERPLRTPLVARWAVIAGVVAVVSVVLIVGAVVIVGSMRRVTVPDVSGVALTEAQATLAGAGLTAEVTERRFSSEARDTVLDQEPPAGAELSKGDTVRLMVSAGTEDFAMPDVIGEVSTTAATLLEARGLVISVETLVSDAPADTVLASTPAPGAVVRTGDRVVLQVAASTAPGVVLQPYGLDGVSVTIDPAPPVRGSADISLEVGRRLGALLEASGASVTMLRSTAASSTDEADRARRAAESTSTFAVGFGLSQSATAGRSVQFPSQGTAQVIASSSLLASAITSELANAAPPTSAASSPADAVLGASRVPWVRILLGSQVAREDSSLFADPTWSDKVAQAVYTGIGKAYGTVQQP
jgi:hypothetical protein